MATIPSFAEWTSKTTLGVLKPRSPELKNVDVALKQFEADRNGTALKSLALAWNQWKRTKTDWKASERNKGGILQQLNDGIAERLGPLGGGMSEKEKAAMVYMDQMRRLAVQRMFKGKRVKLKFLNSANEARKGLAQLKDASTALKELGASAGAAGGAASAAKESIQSMLSGFFDVASIDIISPFLMQTFGTDLVASMTPVVGHIKSAAGVLKSWGTVAKTKYDEVSNRKHKYFVGGGGGDLDKAFSALDQLLTGEVGNAAIDASMKTSSFAARSLLATLSDVMNMTVVEFGGLGWKEDVEFIKKKHIDPVRKKSFDLIDKSVFELEGMSPLVQASKLDKTMKLVKIVM